MNSKMKKLAFVLTLIWTLSCTQQPAEQESEPITKTEKLDWDNATIYFLLTDRFNNGDPSNDINFDRTQETALLRNFMGGDIKGITQKINEGYFTDLGIDAIWFSPVFEQIHGFVDEGSGVTYGFHGYWTKDWTALDPNFGTMDDLKDMVEAAHSKGIRILMDVVLNHTGPVTDKDPVWPADWVRTSPTCEYKDFETTANCTLVKNLPDILTESNETVELPAQLIEKWKAEGRYEQEMASLDAFFEKTKYPRAPRFYIMKWLVDYINLFGIDGFRFDTVKHLREDAFSELYSLAKKAFKNWKAENPEKVLDDNDFFMVGEVYGYGISGKQYYNFGDRKVNYFDYGFQSLINFEFVWDAQRDYEFIFNKYDSLLSLPEMERAAVLNYISSHDDGNPYDAKRERAKESATKLLLSRGGVQIYYGDETARSLVVPGTVGDATLRSFMNWEALEQDSTREILAHWQKLGQFRKNHGAVGAGKHKMLQQNPYVFARSKDDNHVVIGLDMPSGEKTIGVSGYFENGTMVKDSYSNQVAEVREGKVTINSTENIVLLAKQ